MSLLRLQDKNPKSNINVFPTQSGDVPEIDMVSNGYSRVIMKMIINSSNWLGSSPP
jgi:hypothetical protein